MHNLEDKVCGKTKLKLKVSHSFIHCKTTYYAQRPDHTLKGSELKQYHKLF